MATHNRFVVGLFDEPNEARTVVKELKSAGFDHIDVKNRGENRGLTGHLENHGVPDSHSHFYAEGVRRGGTLVTLFTDDGHYTNAVELMRRHGAVDINKRASYYKKGGYERHDENAPPYNEEKYSAERKEYGTHEHNEGETVLPEIEEKIHIGKEKVQRGGVRVFARETEVPVEESVTLRDEVIDVYRQNVDRAATADDMKAFNQGEVVVTETDERAVVSKEARVTGEVHVGKHAEEKTETVRDTVKKREVEVEQIEGGTTTSGTTTKTNR